MSDMQTTRPRINLQDLSRREQQALERIRRIAGWSDFWLKDYARLPEQKHTPAHSAALIELVAVKRPFSATLRHPEARPILSGHIAADLLSKCESPLKAENQAQLERALPLIREAAVTIAERLLARRERSLLSFLPRMPAYPVFGVQSADRGG